MALLPVEKRKVISSCNDLLISDWNYDRTIEFPSDWFRNLFTFLGNAKLIEHLGDEFYQTRFAFTLMETLSLPMGKNKGFVKFQIIQYASICEALLNYTIDTYFKDEFETRYASTAYKEVNNALSAKTKLTYDGAEVLLCSTKKEKAQTNWTSNPLKAGFALEKAIITEDTKEKYCALYDLRNNAHIIKAASTGYYPKIKESKDAYALVFTFISEIKAYFLGHPLVEYQE